MFRTISDGCRLIESGLGRRKLDLNWIFPDLIGNSSQLEWAVEEFFGAMT